jgi:DnaK suppressor protein
MSLLSRREELVADMLHLDSELRNTQTDSDRSEELACSSEYEQAEVVAGLLQAGWDELCEINEALRRMDDGTYGVCLATGAPIGIERLRARPWAKHGIEHPRALEKSGPG